VEVVVGKGTGVLELKVSEVTLGSGTGGIDEALPGGGGWGCTPVGTAIHSITAVVLGPTIVNAVGVGVGIEALPVKVEIVAVSDTEEMLAELVAVAMEVGGEVSIEKLAVLVTGSVEFVVLLVDGKEQM
jgi:hypothetical protein